MTQSKLIAAVALDAAAGHGVNVFVFGWYWFDGGAFLEISLNNGFLKAGNNAYR